MHLIFFILIILLIIFSPTILGITALSLALIVALLLKMAIPISILFIAYWIIGFIGKEKKDDLIFRRWMFAISVLIGALVSLILWVGEQYVLSCLVFIISVIYQSAKQSAVGDCTKYDDRISYASVIILSWYIPMILSSVFFYDYLTTSELGIEDSPGITTILIALFPLFLFLAPIIGDNTSFVGILKDTCNFVKKHMCYFICLIFSMICGVFSNYIYLLLYGIFKEQYYSYMIQHL